MKKVLLCIFIITVLLFTSCKNQPKNSVSSSSSDPTVAAPEYVANLYKSYQKIAKENKLTFEVKEFKIEKDFSTGKPSHITFYFTPPNADFWEGHTLFANLNEKSFRFSIESNLKKDNPQMFKDIITATILVLDDTISSDKAKVKTQSFVNSIDDDKFSNILEVTEYKIVFPPLSISSATLGSYDLHILFSSELNKKVKTSEYPEVVFENIDKPDVNSGMKYKIKGKVLTNHIQQKYDLSSTMKVLSSDGKQYMIAYDHAGFLKKFEINETYTFYGDVTDKLADLPTLYLHYYE